MKRVELYEKIRKANREEGLGIRALATRFGVHRRTVRQALVSAMPPARKVPERTRRRSGPGRAWSGSGWARTRAPLANNATLRTGSGPGLTEEHGAELSESTVRAFVAQARAELEGHTHKVTVPQAHAPGAEAEVDFGQFSAYVDGRLELLWMFCMRLSFSGRGYHEAFGNQAVESFLEGHVNAFEHFGGVPTGMVRYDNLKDAVVKVLLGRARLENERFVALRSRPPGQLRGPLHRPLLWDGLRVARAANHLGGGTCPPGTERRARSRPTRMGLDLHTV